MYTQSTTHPRHWHVGPIVNSAPHVNEADQSAGLTDGELEDGEVSDAAIGTDVLSHLILRIKCDAKSYVRPEISHTHKLTNYE